MTPDLAINACVFGTLAMTALFAPPIAELAVVASVLCAILSAVSFALDCAIGHPWPAVVCAVGFAWNSVVAGRALGTVRR